MSYDIREEFWLLITHMRSLVKSGHGVNWIQNSIAQQYEYGLNGKISLDLRYSSTCITIMIWFTPLL